MTEHLHKTTQEMIDDYYKKDRLVSWSIFVLALIGVVTVLVSAVWLHQSRAKLDVQQTQILKLQKQVDTRVQDVQNQIRCVGEYFTQTDRANLRIPSLNNCHIVRIK